MSVKKIPLRQCIGCGEMKSKKEMIRVIKTAEGEILLDATGRKVLDRLKWAEENIGDFQSRVKTAGVLICARLWSALRRL